MNQQLVKQYILAYKANFNEISEKEIYKWEAVAHFQKFWNIEAEDFPAMLHESIRITSNLLASGNYLPRRMINKCAERYPEFVRESFRKIYNSESPLSQRFEEFKWDYLINCVNRK